MKKWAFYLVLVLLAACAKDDVKPVTQQEITPTTSNTYLAVNVNFADCTTGICVGVPIENASVLLFKNETDIGNDQLATALETDQNGSAVFHDLDQKTYVIVVDCDYGGTSEVVNTPIGEYTSILIEFE